MWVIIEKLAHEKISRILRKKSCDVIALSSNVTLLCDVIVFSFDVNTYNIQSLTIKISFDPNYNERLHKTIFKSNDAYTTSSIAKDKSSQLDDGRRD